MNHRLVIIVSFLLFFYNKTSFAQNNTQGYKPGDVVNESVLLYDTALNAVNFKIPVKGCYVLMYRYRTVSIGKGFDNADSIRLLEEKISSVLLGGMVGNLRVICLSYDKITDYDQWLKKIKTDRPFKPSAKYKVEYYNLNGNAVSEIKCRDLFTKLVMYGPDGRLLRWSSSIARFDYHIKDENIKLKGKLVTNDNGNKEPLNEAFIHIQAGNKRDTLGKATTDKYGDFEIKIPNNDTAYTIKAYPKNKNTRSILLLTQEGKEISRFKKTDTKFEYKLLPADILELAEMPLNDDIYITFKKFETSKQKELMVIENIIYGFEKYNIEKESEEKLNEVVSILKANPAVKLEIISHTDSRGDDDVNLALSKKRANAVAEFLIKNGIDQKRITATGKGESDIRNRCSNSVSCSDKEHGYNRRTEFNFIK
jgi:outer membrane protein OmpA-like peptidoglycan-associated protein